MKNCENCQQEHQGSYGSGRFCSSTCARGFSTKSKRIQINLKVSQKVSGIDSHTGQKARIATKICPICEKEFTTKWNKRYKIYCTTNCQQKYNRTEEYKKQMSEMMINRIIEGKHTNFGKSIKCDFIFNENVIKCDSKLEYSALLFFSQNYNVINIERCSFYIPYIDYKGNLRNFIPDFIIKTDTDIYVVECKHNKTGTTLNEKWNNYIENSKIKKRVLEEYCYEHNFKNFWYTNTTSKLYSKICSTAEYIHNIALRGN